MIGYNVDSLFKIAFGTGLGGAFKIPDPPSADIIQSWAGFNQYKPELKGDEAMGTETRKSWMGTPIMFPWKLKGGNGLRQYGKNGEIVRVKMEDFNMPPVTLVDFSRSKNIQKTNVLGSHGTVKENFGFEDWNINIRGLILNEPGIRTAEYQRRELLKFESLLESIEVEGFLFSRFPIYAIVIESVTFRQIEGKPWVIPFEIEAVSDYPLEFTI